jgi:hypothetical protein
MKMYRLNVTAHGEPSAIFALVEDVDSLLQALEHRTRNKTLGLLCEGKL